MWRCTRVHDDNCPVQGPLRVRLIVGVVLKFGVHWFRYIDAPEGILVPLNIGAAEGRYIEGRYIGRYIGARYIEGRYIEGPYIEGPYIGGRYIGAPEGRL
jgi:hypothetical protein